MLTLAARAVGADLAIEIDLTAQKAWLLHEGARIYTTPVSSGRAGYRTRTGNFQVVQKDADHLSTLYGALVDAGGRTLVAGADSGMPVPKGGRFVAAPMPHFLRFDGATGMHAGHLPGHPASHGCVRLPPAKAALFFNIVEIGTPVRVFGTTPAGPEPKPPPAPTLAATPAATPPPKKSWFPFLARTTPTPAQKQTRPGNDSGPR